MTKKYKLYTTVFVSGFVLMVFEIVGSRVLAPFLGSSLIVWTSIIGVILGCMSLGYWYGGKWADKAPSFQRLAAVLVWAGLAILAMNLGKNTILKLIAIAPFSLGFKSVFASIVLFSIPSFLLAFVSPFAIRIGVLNVSHTGETAGNIYAVSTIGSIVGTFFSGFVLIALLGTNQILWLLGLTLIALAGVLAFSEVRNTLFFAIILLAGNIYYSLKTHHFIDVDTNYSRVFITEQLYRYRHTRFLQIDGYVNSGMYLNAPNELVFKYTKYYDYFEVFCPSFKQIVMFGGAGFSYPKHFQQKFPHKKLDIVEIDPELTQLAEEYFNFTPSENIRVFHQDARMFLISPPAVYDAVLIDLITSDLSVPFHLTTRESFALVSNILNDSGVVLVNIIGTTSGKPSPLLQAITTTMRNVFPQVLVINTQGTNYQGQANFMLVGLKSKQKINIHQTGLDGRLLASDLVNIDRLSESFILTDNYAPANFLLTR